jgi:hypothetical protein
MIPLAVLAGLQLPECECANGEHRILCPHALGRASRRLETSSKSCCAPATQCCCQKKLRCDSESDASHVPCGHCKIVAPKSFVYGAIVAIPELPKLPFCVIGSEVADPLHSSTLLAWDIAQAHDIGPPDDLVVIHCCLLI